METQYDLDVLTSMLSDTTWNFSTEVIAAFEGIGLSAPKAMRSFILIAESSELVQDGAVEASVMGLSLQVERRGWDIYVDLL